MYRIYIVEDDDVIAGVLKEHLKSWGFEARCTKDFNKVMEEFAAFNPQMVLLDISLPFFNGYYWCSEIRKISKIPVIFLSSASDNMNIVMAMNMGGDDFIAKPFDLTVLMAKVQALLRRSYDYVGQTGLLEHKGVILNTGECTVTYREQTLELTKNENRILTTLMENKGETVSRELLMNKLWESDAFVDENTLSVNVTRLRKKLESAGIEDFVHTKKGVGYLIG